MRILVAHVSVHGSTALMAHQVAAVLTEAGHHVVTAPVEEVDRLDAFDALVLGAAVYRGAWPPPAVDFVDRVLAEAPELPTWVFASGPVGDEPFGTSEDADAVAARLRPRDYVVFPGVVDHARLGADERGAAEELDIQDGDFSDPYALRDWARGVAVQVRGEGADW